jgi:hypothetical protein
VVHGSFDDEPWVEILVVHPLGGDQVDGNLTHGKNPRSMHFNRETTNGNQAYQCRIHEKVVADRRMLLDRRPADQLGDDLVDILKRWMAKRYVRAALPDEFNNRIRNARTKIKGILQRDGVVITGVYLSLDSEEELSPGETYRLLIYTTVLPETHANGAAFDMATRATAQLHAALNGCKGIEVKESMTYSEDELTLSDIRDLTLWDDFDYLSTKSGTTLPAS